MTKMTKNVQAVRVSEDSETTPPEEISAPSPGISIYSGASLGDVSEMMSDPELPTGLVLNVDPAAMAAGTVVDIIFRDQRAGGFSLTNMRLAPDYILPAHRHNVDCLYYVQSGYIVLGRQRIDAGGGFLVRANRPYGYRAGPQGATVLEFRASTQFNMVITETSPAKWDQIERVVDEHGGWPRFASTVALPKE